MKKPMKVSMATLEFVTMKKESRFLEKLLDSLKGQGIEITGRRKRLSFFSRKWKWLIVGNPFYVAKIAENIGWKGGEK